MIDAAPMFSPLDDDDQSIISPPRNSDGWTIISPVPDDAPRNMPRHRLGNHNGSWPYRNEEGKLLFVVCRFDKPDGGKEFLPLSYWQDAHGKCAWRWKGHPSIRPLYNLDRLSIRPDAPVLIVEGEKAADAAQQLFPDYVTITSPGGSKAAKKADWTSLNGRSVVIWPDNDDVGANYAVDAAEYAIASGAASVAIVGVLKEFPLKWDLADALPVDWTIERLQTLLDNATPFAAVAAVAASAAGGEAPRPLFRELPDPDPFPVDELGSLLGNAARAIHDKVQAPMAICAQSVLAAATLSVQGHADVVLPHGQAKPISSFFLTVAATGERKSAADHEALWPIRKYEQQLREKYDAELPDYLNSLEAWEKQRKQILSNKTDYPDVVSKENALDAIGSKPKPPLSPMLTSTDPTFEGLAKQYVSGQPSVGVFSAEGGQFIGGHGMSQEAKLRTAAGLSTMWDGDPIKRVRAGDGASILPGRRLSMHLMAQPDVAAVMLSDRVLADQGLLSRLLVAAPSSAAGKRSWHEPKSESDLAIKRYGARLLSIFERPLPLADGKTNELTPRQLPLSPIARQAWIEFADLTEAEMIAGLEPILGLANKLPEHAARLAATLTLIENINAEEISAEHMVAGIKLAEYYASEALRLFAAGHTNPDLLLAQKTLDWVGREWREEQVSLRVLYTKGPNPIRDSKTAKRIANILADHGWFILADKAIEIDGHKTKDAWRIVRGQHGSL